MKDCLKWHPDETILEPNIFRTKLHILIIGKETNKKTSTGRHLIQNLY